MFQDRVAHRLALVVAALVVLVVVGTAGYVIAGVVIVAAIFAAMTSFYTVGPDEEGVVLRFGRYLKSVNPGLHWKIPFLIDSVQKVKVDRVYKLDFPVRS